MIHIDEPAGPLSQFAPATTTRPDWVVASCAGLVAITARRNTVPGEPDLCVAEAL